MAINKVKTEETKSNNSVLGQFTGKCCDANVFNNNDMHLSRELFEKLMESEEYKRAIENGHYIGYAGHPENPDCQEFEHTCIVLKDMRILDNGEIEGDFDLIDTPVGRVVKAFIDAGVKFGISIRGLGDVDASGEVDPEGFVFRGYDLVTFPAYDDCIPKFKAIAASTDARNKSTYKKVCAAIDNNIGLIDDADTLKFIQDPLIEGSDEFNKIQERIDELALPEEDIIVETVPEDECCDVTKDQLEAMTELYLNAMNRVRELESALTECQTAKQEIAVACSTARAKYSHMRRIVASQLDTAKQTSEAVKQDNSNLIKQSRISDRKLARLTASLDRANNELKEVKGKLAVSQASYEKMVTANTNLRNKIDYLTEEKNTAKEAVEAANHMNLKYKHKIDATSDVISQKDSAIEDIKRQLHETVVANKQLESKASNLDEQNGELLSRVEAAEEMVLSYQQAYANIYANALGVYLKDLPVTASTSVDELKRMISAGTSTAGIPAVPNMESDEEVIEGDDVIEDEVDEFDDNNYSAGLVTL